ncbi:MAG: hypothetical protein WDO56_20310 [Gammaproteobacteria bacterium]
MKNSGIGGLFVVVVAASLLAACAAPAPVKPATSAAAAGAAAPPAAALASNEKKPLDLGRYRRVVKNDVEYFCAREAVTGSRTETFDRCLTQAQLNAIQTSGQDFLRRQQNHVGEQFTPSLNNTSPSMSAVSP